MTFPWCFKTGAVHIQTHHDDAKCDKCPSLFQCLQHPRKASERHLAEDEQRDINRRVANFLDAACAKYDRRRRLMWAVAIILFTLGLALGGIAIWIWCQ